MPKENATTAGSNGHDAGAGWAPASAAAPAWSDVPVQPYERTLPADERELLKYRLEARTAQALVDKEEW